MTTTIRPDYAAFVGFVAPSERPNLSASYYKCPSGYQFVSSATFYGCCPGTSVGCPIATTCVNATLSFAASTSSCQVGSCQTQLLVPSIKGPTTTEYFCGTPLKFGKTLYRADPTKTQSPSSSPTGEIIISRTTSPPSPSTYGQAPGTPPRPPPSRAWITGAVLGTLAMVTLLGIGMYLFLQRRHRCRRCGSGGGGGSEGGKFVEAASQKDASFYYNQDMKPDTLASRGPWSPYSSGYGSLRRWNKAGRPASQESRHELAGERSPQVYIELPEVTRPQAVELQAGLITNETRRPEGAVRFAPG